MGGLSVSSGTPDLLHVALEALGHVVVDDAAHVRLVQAHAEGHGGHHHPQLPAHEVILDPPPLRSRHASVVGLGNPLQRLADLLLGFRDKERAKERVCEAWKLIPLYFPLWFSLSF